MGEGRQPYLHDQVPLVAAPTQVWSAASGDIDDGSVGVVFSDVRVISRLQLTFDGRPVTWLDHRSDSATLTCTGIIRHLQSESTAGADPRVIVVRTRQLTVEHLYEHITITSALTDSVTTDVQIAFMPALDPIDDVKRGVHHGVHPAPIDPDGLTWSDGAVAVVLSADGPLTGTDPIRLRRRMVLHPHLPAAVEYTLAFTAPGETTAVVAAGPAPIRRPPTDSCLTVTRGHGTGLDRWLDQSLTDLDSLRLEHRDVPGQPFLGAGAPWYLTLFGRDSLWAARLLLPFDPEPARSTLRVLAAFQGCRHDLRTEEAPGKIIHEIRNTGFTALPTRYYGTIDATSLWVNLLIDLVDAGQLDGITEHLPALETALAWLTGPDADPDGDGFIEYHRPDGSGLANQGWKDSVDAVRFADGHLADGPIALCEVQGYAYRAAHRGAELLTSAGRPADRHAIWAAELRVRFHRQFLHPDGLPAFALDGHKDRVDATTSNPGHLLGTGILDPHHERLVAERLLQPDMFSGFGVRTMSSRDAGYHPLSYHCGSVWAHDTAIIIDAMTRASLHDHANHLARGLLAAAHHYHHRLPELWSGQPDHPIPYPAACHPQAWAAAAAIPAIRALQRPTAGTDTAPADTAR